jgi:hypothetical protein
VGDDDTRFRRHWLLGISAEAERTSASLGLIFSREMIQRDRLSGGLFFAFTQCLLEDLNPNLVKLWN